MAVRVGHIITRLDFGGAQQNTLHTVRRLDRSRFEPLLIRGPGGVLEGGEEPARTILVEELGRPVRPGLDLIALLRLARLLAAERPAVVHTHSSKAGILGRLAAALAGVPVVVHTFHGFGFHDRMPAAVKAFYVALERLAAAGCARLVFVSRSNMEEAARLKIGDPDRYVLIRSGIRLADYPAPLADRKAKRAELGLRRDPPLVVGVGNLKPQKNALDFLRVARRVLERAGAATFAYVGDGPLRGQLEAKIVAWGLHGSVRLLGWRRDVPELLAAADAFLLTSLWEGLPRALVEAMKTGLPCAAYAADGVRDVLVDGVNGFLAPPGDWERLADRVVELLGSSQLRRRLGEKAAMDIGEEFDIDHMVRQQENLYEELLKEAGLPC